MITTHVLDTARGRPASRVPVRLERREGARWKEVGRAKTDRDGRARDLLRGRLVRGTYRIVFDTGAYDPAGLFPEVAVVFAVRDASRGYHVPLLWGRFGYATYRGS